MTISRKGPYSDSSKTWKRNMARLGGFAGHPKQRNGQQHSSCKKTKTLSTCRDHKPARSILRLIHPKTCNVIHQSQPSQLNMEGMKREVQKSGLHNFLKTEGGRSTTADVFCSAPRGRPLDPGFRPEPCRQTTVESGSANATTNLKLGICKPKDPQNSSATRMALKTCASQI